MARSSAWDEARSLVDMLRKKAGGVVSKIKQSPYGQLATKSQRLLQAPIRSYADVAKKTQATIKKPYSYAWQTIQGQTPAMRKLQSRQATYDVSISQATRGLFALKPQPKITLKDIVTPKEWYGGKVGEYAYQTIDTAIKGIPPTIYTTGLKIPLPRTMKQVGTVAKQYVPHMLKGGTAMTTFMAGLNALKGQKITKEQAVKSFGTGMLLSFMFTPKALKSQSGASPQELNWARNKLKVSKNATPKQVKNSYLNLAKKSHPDVGGSTIEMAEINKAFELTSSVKPPILNLTGIKNWGSKLWSKKAPTAKDSKLLATIKPVVKPKIAIPPKLPTQVKPIKPPTTGQTLFRGSIRSISANLKLQGKSGTKLSNLLDSSRRQTELLLGKQLTPLMQAIEGIKGIDSKTFSDAIVGKYKPKSTELKAVMDTWGKIETDIAKEVKNLGLSQRNSNQILSRSKLGEVKTPADLINYIDDTYRGIMSTKNLGFNNNKAYKLVKGIGKEGGDMDISKRMLDRVLGKDTPGSLDPLASKLRTYQIVTKLGTGAITNLGQSISTTLRTDIPSTTRAVVQALSPKNKAEAKHFTSLTGEILNSSKQRFVELAGGEAGTLSHKFLEKTKFIASEEFNRIVATNAGRIYTEKLLQQLTNNPNNKAAIRELKALGVDVDKLIKGGLKDSDIISAGKQVSQDTQFDTGAQDLPYFWSSPWGKVVTQFKSFSFKQTQFIAQHFKRVTGEMKKGNLKPLINSLIVIFGVAPIVGEILKDIKSVLKNKKRSDMGWERYFNNLFAVASLGLLEDVGTLATGKYGASGTIGVVGGPTSSDAYKLLQAGQSLTRDRKSYSGVEEVKARIKPLLKYGIKQIPVVGPAAESSLFSNQYTEPYVGVPSAVQSSLKATTEVGRLKQNAIRAILKGDEKGLDKLREDLYRNSVNKKELYKKAFAQAVEDGDRDAITRLLPQIRELKITDKQLKTAIRNQKYSSSDKSKLTTEFAKAVIKKDRKKVEELFALKDQMGITDEAIEKEIRRLK